MSESSFGASSHPPTMSVLSIQSTGPEVPPSPSYDVSDSNSVDSSEVELDSEFYTTISLLRGRSLFDKFEDADMVIQTRDEVQIKCHRWPLARDSAFFRDMFSLPQGASVGSSSPNGDDHIRVLPVIHVEEDAETFENILRLLYPDCEDPDVRTFDQLRSLIRATHKYQFERAQSYVHTYALEDPFVTKYPVDSYVMGLRYDIKGLAQLALSHMSRRNLIGDADVLKALCTGELTGIEYWELMKNHRDQHGLAGLQGRPW
jgi:hypothetical protein